METKICSTCGVNKTFKEFYRDIGRKDGYRNECKKCSYFNPDRQAQLESIFEKTCNTCKAIKPLNAFIKDERRSLGYGLVCIDCSQIKLCRKCQTKKPITEFNRSVRSADGYQYSCKECIKQRKREAYRQDPEKVLRRNNKYVYRKGTREGTRERMLLREYGLTLDAYDELLRQQDYVCKICKTKERERGRKRLAVDHDHKTGEVRGLLCDPCNRALGMFKDDEQILLSAIRYVQGHFG